MINKREVGLGESLLSNKDAEAVSMATIKKIYGSVVETLDRLISERDVSVEENVDWEKEFNALPKEVQNEIADLIIAKNCVEMILESDIRTIKRMYSEIK